MTTKKNQLAALGAILFSLMLMVHGCAVQSGPQQAASQAQPSQRVALDSITASESMGETTVTIAADGPVTFSSFKKPDPPAVVLIFPATRVDKLTPDPNLTNDLIRNVAVSAGNGGQTARIEFQLSADAAYTASQQGNHVLLTFKKPVMAAAASDANPAPAMAASPEAGTPAPAASSAVAPAAAPMAEATSVQAKGTAAHELNIPKSTAWVNKIDFLGGSEGKSTLVLSTTHAVNYQINKISPQKIEIQLLNTRIPSYRQRALITTRFNSAVDRIVPYQRSKKNNDARVSIELRQAVPYYAEQTDNLLMMHFDASSVPPKPMEQAQLPAWKQALAGEEPAAAQPEQPAGGLEPVQVPGQMPESVAAAPPAAGPASPESGLSPEDQELQSILSPRKHYTGEKIALDFYDTDIKNVFRILREVSGKNFAVDKDVVGKVTMTIDKPVPWDQVLDLVLRMNQLGKTYDGDIVRIATLETLKKEDDLRKSQLEALRKSREEAKALEPLVTRYFAVSYSNAKTEIMPHIQKILTEGRGSVSVDEKNNQVIVTDTAEKVKQAQEIIRRIDKVTSQVIIEARVVEVTTSFAKDLGIDWTLTEGPGVIGGSGYSGTTNLAMNFPVTDATSSVGVTFSRLTGVPFVLNAKLNALETTGEGRILSSPKILTLDNKKARIKQGVEYPYLERDSSGGATVKFKDIDLLLEVTPHVTPDNRISMGIFITKNDVADVINGIPSLATNEAQTELLVNDGDTVVIGGIIKRTSNVTESGWPGLRSLPGIGWLFKNHSDTNKNNELLIFLTPRIVQLEQDVAKIIN
jgi:type IV pilus assembly protein PilQ